MLKVCHVCGMEKEHKSWKSTTCNECLDKGLKWCSVCHKVYPLTFFHKNGHTVRSFCKTCEIERSIESHKLNGYYDRPGVKERRNENSRLCKRTKYRFDEEYRMREILRCHSRRDATIGTLTAAQWHECCELFNMSCAYCGAITNLTMDHVVAVSAGGTTEVSNIIPACMHCNSSKQNKDLIEWYTAQPYYSKDRLDKILRYIESKKGGVASVSYRPE